ncbi:alpha-ketoglutarate-dependent taurine dioxygenase [Klebsiella variicola]|nr:alpha-ketoglutarate-dependent taurine dioxygenase [Klebsiella variicola]
MTGADLTRPLSDNQFEQLYHAVLRHQVVFLREQNITPAQQRDLALRFGDLHIHPVYPHAPGVEEIIVLDTHNDNPPDNDNWHTDVTFIDTPPAGAILAAKELPTTGGDTLWTSGIAAWEALSEPFRQLLSGLHAEHDFRKSFQEYKYNKTEAEHRRWQEAVAKHPPLLHPVVRTHPVTGKQALFVNEGFTTRIVEVSEKESAALLNFLFAHVTKPEFQVRWRWQPNDVAIWDNRVTQHYANADYLPQRRIMHRATILGDKPYYRRGNACSRLRHQPRAAEKSGCCIARCFPEAAPDAPFPGDRSVGNGVP